MNKALLICGCASVFYSAWWCGCSDRGQGKTTTAEERVPPQATPQSSGQDKTTTAEAPIPPQATSQIEDSLPLAFKNYKVMADPAKRRFFANLEQWNVIPPDDILDAVVAHLMKPTPEFNFAGSNIALPNTEFEAAEKNRLASRIIYAYSEYRFDEKRFKKDLPVSEKDSVFSGWILSVLNSHNGANPIAASYIEGKAVATPSIADSLFTERLSFQDNSQALLTKYKGKKGIILLGSLNSCRWLGFVDEKDSMDKSQYFSGGCQLNRENTIPVGSLFSFSQVGSITRDHFLKYYAGKSGYQ